MKLVLLGGTEDIMDDLLKKIDEVVKRTNCTYEDAKNALEKYNGDILESIIYIEQNKNSNNSNVKKKGEEILNEIKKIIDKGNVTKITIKRKDEIYSKGNDIRTEFERDYTRILHSLAYRRLKHKTQVFFNTNNDHICTRIEHVNHVESVSYTIARYLGLNVELTRAISTAHDLGHAPFGHEGENIIKEISKKYLNEEFWHEKNGLHFVDEVELLEDNNRVKNNMNLTYAVRDGIISHCGEVDENSIFPREEAIDLMLFDSPGKYQPYTWEGCVVKISDKISYIGRDIEDAIRLKFIGDKELDVLYKIAVKYNHETINTTRLMHELIIDLCENSSPEKGLRLSKPSLNMMDEINKEFNYN